MAGATFLNIDCNACALHTIVKLIDCDSGSALAFGARQLASAACGGLCVDDGSSGAPHPPCEAGEEYLPSQLALAPCTAVSAKRWTRGVV